MKIQRDSSEDEMLLEFLKAEWSSSRFVASLTEALQKFSATPDIILSPNLADAGENALRRKVMGEHRGFGRNDDMFSHYPPDVQWKLCSFSRGDMDSVRYIDYSYWNELSAGTNLPSVAAREIREGRQVYGQSNEGFFKAAEALRQGAVFPHMIFLTADMERFVILEGHFRMTAYALAPECFEGVRCIVGVCSREHLEAWDCQRD